MRSSCRFCVSCDVCLMSAVSQVNFTKQIGDQVILSMVAVLVFVLL